MQKIIDPTEKKSSPETAGFYLNKIYELLGHDPWADIWAKLSPVQRDGVLAVSGIEQNNHFGWVEFTRSECEQIQRTIVLFCNLSEKVRRAVGANREAVAA